MKPPLVPLRFDELLLLSVLYPVAYTTRKSMGRTDRLFLRGVSIQELLTASWALDTLSPCFRADYAGQAQIPGSTSARTSS